MIKLNFLLIVAILSCSYSVESGSAIESIECEFCKKLFAYIYDKLDEDRAIITIENTLDTVCDQIFHDDRAKTCEDYVNKYTPTIVDLVVKTTDPDEACTLLQLCHTSVQSKSLLEFIAEKIFEADAHNDRCKECMIDVDSLRSDFKLARQEHIPKLQQACGQFPTSDGLCDSFIKNVDSIYDYLESNFVPEEACSTFGVCSSIQAQPTFEKSAVSKVEPDCLLCKQVFKLVDQVINKQAKFDIEFAFDKVCNTIVPSGSRKACRKLVDKYTTQLINFIIKHTDPDTACLMIGMCKEEHDFINDLMSLTSKT